MDSIVQAFGTALVGAIATDSWQRVRDAVTALWHRVHPQQDTGAIGMELAQLRELVLQARRDGDADAERAIEGAWQVKLHQLLQADPTLAAELRRVLDQVLTPALTPVEQTRIETIIMTGSSHGSSTFYQIGINKGRP
jgi:hypothetical protein